VSSFGQTSDGLSIKDPPLAVPGTITDTELGQRVRGCLAAFHTGISRPNVEEMTAAGKEGLRALGFRSRRAYEGRVAIAGIDQDGEAYSVYPYRRMERSGHGSVEELTVSLSSPSDEELGRAVRSALAQSGPEAPRWRSVASPERTRPVR